MEITLDLSPNRPSTTSNLWLGFILLIVLVKGWFSWLKDRLALSLYFFALGDIVGLLKFIGLDHLAVGERKLYVVLLLPVLFVGSDTWSETVHLVGRVFYQVQQAERLSWIFEIDSVADASNEFSPGRKSQRWTVKLDIAHRSVRPTSNELSETEFLEIGFRFWFGWCVDGDSPRLHWVILRVAVGGTVLSAGHYLI